MRLELSALILVYITKCVDASSDETTCNINEQYTTLFDPCWGQQGLETYQCSAPQSTECRELEQHSDDPFYPCAAANIPVFQHKNGELKMDWGKFHVRSRINFQIIVFKFFYFSH